MTKSKVTTIYKVWWNRSGALEVATARATKTASQYRIPDKASGPWWHVRYIAHADAHETPEAAIAAFIEEPERRRQHGRDLVKAAEKVIMEAKQLCPNRR